MDVSDLWENRGFAYIVAVWPPWPRKGTGGLVVAFRRMVVGLYNVVIGNAGIRVQGGKVVG